MRKLAVIFPGAGYGLDSPLLYYADFLFESKGYERVRMEYSSILSCKEFSVENKIKVLREYVWSQIEGVDFGQYDEVVFLSKSIGAIEAGVLADRLDISIKQIFFTPVKEAASYLKTDSIFVIGTKDKEYSFYKEQCEEKNVTALYIEGADHLLEIQDSPFDSIKVLENVMQFISAEIK